jgi:uncharacterized NAD(P)/FAD-binding protein YdhS
LRTAGAPDSHPGQVDVAIVGGGFCGTMVAVHLLERAQAPLSIALFDGNNAFGRGVAYGTDCPDHLLNVVASKMSAFEDRPDSFVEWLRAHPNVLFHLGMSGVDPDDFVPRAAYGWYLRSLLEEAILASPRARLTRIVSQVGDLEPTGDGFRISVVGSPSMTAKAVVVATGNRPPSDVPIRADGFYRSELYVRNPWSRAASGRIQRASDILILGSGLTGLDAVMTARRGARVRSIHLLSRRGHMPLPHRVAKPYAGDLSDLSGVASIRDLVRAVRRHVERAAAEGCDWRSVVDALRPSTPAIWQALDLESRLRFLHHVRPYWETHRHRAAPAVVIETAALEAAGFVKRHSGRLRAIEEKDGRAHATFVDRRTGSVKTLVVDAVVNCTGPPTDVSRADDALMHRLIARGLARQDPLRLGLDHTDAGALVGADGRSSDRLFALGGVRRGVLYESTAVPELRKQADDLGRLLAASPARGSGDGAAADDDRPEPAAIVL